MKWNCFVVPHVTHVLVCNYAALSQGDTDQWEAGWVVSNQSDERIAVGNHTNLNKSEVCLYFLSVFNIWILDQRGFVVRRQIVACDRSCESDLDFPKWTAINAVVIRIKWQFTQSPGIKTNLMISYRSEAVSLKTKWSTKPSWSPKHKTIAKKNFLRWGGSPYLSVMQDMQVPVLGYSAS